MPANRRHLVARQPGCSDKTTLDYVAVVSERLALRDHL
jgi:hypothetical protein